MNRLILIGNGFDLAHGLQTSYSHFICDYLCQVLNSFMEKDAYEDPLIQIKLTSTYLVNPKETETVKPDTALKAFNKVMARTDYTVKIKSALLKETLNKLEDLNWVDLENEYFDQLLRLQTTKGFHFKSVTKLNDEFEFLKQNLITYLIHHENEYYTYSIFKDHFCNIFQEPFKQCDFVNQNISEKAPDNLYFLSFNYTATSRHYKNKCAKTIPTQHNQIHGDLNSTDNPVIFGFGDEYDKNYVNFEDIKNKELLKHIKSFSYFKTTKYHDLLRFLEADYFQVYVFGHSCGLSDRTMLKHIFENDKCKSIKIFYHDQGDGKNDFTDKTYDLAKHFSDKGLLRKILVPFHNSVAMPQVFKRHPAMWDPGEF
jgi:hypothetical protein